MFDDTKWIIRSRKWKDRQYSEQKRGKRIKGHIVIAKRVKYLMAFISMYNSYSTLFLDIV